MLQEKADMLVRSSCHCTASTTYVCFFDIDRTKYKSQSFVPPPFLFHVLWQCHLLQILKLYAWEPSFQAQVESIRGQELNVMKKFAYLTSVSTFIFSCAPALVSHVKKTHKKMKHFRLKKMFANAFFPFTLFPGHRFLWPPLQCS